MVVWIWKNHNCIINHSILRKCSCWCSMSWSEFLFCFLLSYLYLSMPKGWEKTSWQLCGCGVMGGWPIGPIGPIGPMIALPGAEGISWMKEVGCLWLWVGWIMFARRCSCSNFRFIIHFLIHLITNSASIAKLNISNMVSMDKMDWELLEMFNNPTFTFSSLFPAVLADALALWHIVVQSYLATTTNDRQEISE